MKSLRLEDPTYLGKVLVAEGSAAAIGRHVHAVFSSAEAGSTLANQVIAEGGQKLAHLVGCLLKQGAHGDCIVAGGGVIARQPSLMRAFEDAVRPIAPDWDVTLLTTAPVEGAVRLATQLLQGEAPTNLPAPRWSEQHRTRLRKPLGPIGYKRSVG
jgi:predicted NBD/HSP70 family sugar kinase